MKDTLLVYYSLEGNTAFVAETASACADMDVELLDPVSEPPKKGFGKFFWGGKSVVMNETPGLAPLGHDPDGYKNLILAFPVWAGSYPPAFATFFKEHKLSDKTCCIIACSAGGNAKKAFEKVSKHLEGCMVKDTLSLIDPARDRDKNVALIKEFIGRNFS